MLNLPAVSFCPADERGSNLRRRTTTSVLVAPPWTPPLAVESPAHHSVVGPQQPPTLASDVPDEVIQLRLELAQAQARNRELDGQVIP